MRDGRLFVFACRRRRGDRAGDVHFRGAMNGQANDGRRDKRTPSLRPVFFSGTTFIELFPTTSLPDLWFRLILSMSKRAFVRNASRKCQNRQGSARHARRSSPGGGAAGIREQVTRSGTPTGISDQRGEAIHISPLVRVCSKQSATRIASSSVDSGRSLMPRCEDGRSALTMAYSTLGSASQEASVSYRGSVAPTFQDPSVPVVRWYEFGVEPRVPQPARNKARHGATIRGGLLMPNSKVAGCQDEYGEVNCVGWPASLLAVVF